MKYFNRIEDLIHLKRSYRRLFETEDGKRVLRDLAKLCHAASTTADADPREHARKEGKRQVWLRIQNMLHVPDADLVTMTKENDNV